MTRHARNCTAGAVYTYHEKKKDAQASGYGTNTQRVGKDSIKDFDCCSLTLQPCRNPVVTKDGYLFDKEAILEYIITKKNEYSRKLKEFEKQKRKEETELAELAAAEERSKLNNFLKTEKNIVSAPIKAFKSVQSNHQLRMDVYTFPELADMVMCYWEARGNERRALCMYQQQFQNRNHPHHTMFARLYQRLRDNGSLHPQHIGGRLHRYPFSVDDYTELKGKDPLKVEKPSVSNMTEGRDKHLPSFWIPSKTPEAKDKSLKKPDKTIYCPVSGKPLKPKDLIDVKFTQVKDPDDKKALIVKENRYMCAVTHDILSNSVPCAVIRTTGDIVTMECVEKIIKKDWIHPLTGEKLKEEDVIPLQRGGTGYSTTNNNLEGKHERPVLQA